MTEIVLENSQPETAYISPLAAHPFGRAITGYLEEHQLSPGQLIPGLRTGNKEKRVLAIVGDPTKVFVAGGYLSSVAEKVAHTIGFDLKPYYGLKRTVNGWIDTNIVNLSPSSTEGPAENHADAQYDRVSELKAGHPLGEAILDYLKTNKVSPGELLYSMRGCSNVKGVTKEDRLVELIVDPDKVYTADRKFIMNLALFVAERISFDMEPYWQVLRDKRAARSAEVAAKRQIQARRKTSPASMVSGYETSPDASVDEKSTKPADSAKPGDIKPAATENDKSADFIPPVRPHYSRNPPLVIRVPYEEEALERLAVTYPPFEAKIRVRKLETTDAVVESLHPRYVLGMEDKKRLRDDLLDLAKTLDPVDTRGSLKRIVVAIQGTYGESIAKNILFKRAVQTKTATTPKTSLLDKKL